ncbi:MAG: alanine--tRNA ligase-related protein [Patescibacteria group bacterium]
MDSRTLRKKYLDYFKSKGHSVIPSSSLVPENDPTVLFTTAGMFPLIPYFLGEKHPEGSKLADAQKCIRTDDIEEVGDLIHHTFFEMLGNWSFGDYFKQEAIEWSFEFLTGKDYLNIPLEKMAFSVFAGDEDAPFDRESYNKWLSLGVKSERIAKLPKKNNWWKPGDVGPCGPDTEMFYWSGALPVPARFDPDNASWVEIWNNVFMQFFRNPAGKLEVLKQKNVDTGMGLERTLAVLNGYDDNYKTDLFVPIIGALENISDKKYENYKSEFRIIADHIKAAVFAINDGVMPSNKERGYVVRRLIRRAVVKANEIGIKDNFTTKIAEKVFEIYEGVYFGSVIPAPDQVEGKAPAGIQNNKELDSGSQAAVRNDTILVELEKEETKFRKTLASGLKLISSKKELSSHDLFDLYQSFGIPLEIALEEANKLGLNIETDTIRQFHELVKRHQELSRTASAGMFKGGLADAGEETTKLHTAAHLLLQALRQVLGGTVLQKGANITAERLRFDFSYPEKMTQAQISAVEAIVNEKIEEDLPVDMEEMTLEDAKACGAMGVFDSKYGEKVKVYTIRTPQGGGAFSREICGGPHVTHTGVLGKFKIAKEESSSAGVRRIKAVLE